MRISTIITIFIIIQLTKVYCRPDRLETKDTNYPDDPPQDYEDDADENESNHTPLGPPEIKSKSLLLEVRPGVDVELPCVVANAEELAVTWNKGDANLFLGDFKSTVDKRIVRTANNSLIIRNVTITDSSTYNCQILMQPKNIELTHHLRVVSKPKEPTEETGQIKVTPGRRVEVNQGDKLTLGCVIKTQSMPQIIWSHKGERIHDAHAEANGQRITIENANRRHSGRYQCLVDFGNNKLMHEYIEVIVRFSPMIQVEHEVVHSGIGLTANLTCKVHAHPHAKVTWQRNGKAIGDKSDVKKYIVSEEKSMRTLTVEHITANDFGPYYCQAANSMGKNSMEIILAGTPTRPKFFGGEIADDEMTMKLKWIVESYSPIIEYKLDYRRTDSREWKTASPNVKDGAGNIFTIEYALEGLEPGASYETFLLAKNEFGWSPKSDVQPFRKDYVSDEPQNVKGSEGRSNASTSRPVALFVAAILVLTFYGSTFV